MNIIHLVWQLGVGGMECMLIDEITELCRRGHSVSLIIADGIYSKQQLDCLPNSVEIFKFSKTPSILNPLRFHKIRNLIKQISPDVIVCHNATLSKIVSRLDCCKKVVHIHSTKRKINPYVHKFDSVIAISQSVQKDISGRSRACSEVIYNGVPIKEILCKGDYSLYNFKLICIGRLNVKQKGQDILLKSLKSLKENYSRHKWSLDFIGDGEDKEYLENLSKELNLTDKISFLGVKKRFWIYQNLKNYDLFVLPSRYEGFGNVVVEAMAARVPVLYSAVKGALEIMKGEKYGWAFEPENIESCAKKMNEIVKIYRSPMFKDKIELSLNRAKDFDISVMVDNLENVYFK